MERALGGRHPRPTTPIADAATLNPGSREEELKALRSQADGLRQQLAEVMERLKRLGKKGQ
jgi:hypothetical protein